MCIVFESNAKTMIQMNEFIPRIQDSKYRIKDSLNNRKRKKSKNYTSCKQEDKNRVMHLLLPL